MTARGMNMRVEKKRQTLRNMCRPRRTSGGEPFLANDWCEVKASSARSCYRIATIGGWVLKEADLATMHATPKTEEGSRLPVVVSSNEENRCGTLGAIGIPILQCLRVGAHP